MRPILTSVPLAVTVSSGAQALDGIDSNCVLAEFRGMCPGVRPVDLPCL